MLGKATAYGLIGLDGYRVDVETDVGAGLPRFDIVGLPDASVKEAKERVRAAVKNSGKKFPDGAVTVNLAPADVRKEGSQFDLAIAVAVIKASSELICGEVRDYVLIGELSLDGKLRGVTGILPLLISAKNCGFSKFIIPKENEKEAAYIYGTEIYACASLNEALGHLSGVAPAEKIAAREYRPSSAFDGACDLKFVRGQAAAKRALEIAVCGGHNILFVGAPGSGKTMLAKCIPSIMPDMSFEEALETTKIHSVAGLTRGSEGIISKRPFFTPHHTATNISLIGGGSNSRPGIISLAHNGVLYLDEMPEYSRNTLECLRQPLEDRVITVSRAKSSVCYPASFMLVGSMNPCPCGNYGSKTAECRCTQAQIAKYRAKLSGPLLDRIDIQIEVDGVKYEELCGGAEEESSDEVKKRVDRTRAIQRERFREDGIRTNGEMGEKQLKKYCALSPECEKIMRASFEKLKLSARGRSRILKVARTVADAALEEKIAPSHILEAVGYRSFDFNA